MADTIEKPVGDTGYDSDFYLWTQQQAELLRRAARDRINAPIDWENVAEEVESLGRQDRREIKRLVFDISVLLLMLKTSSREEPRPSWRDRLQKQRYDLELILDDSPSLRKLLPDFLRTQWNTAVEEASACFEGSHDSDARGRLASVTAGEFSDKDILNDDFFPESLAH